MHACVLSHVRLFAAPWTVAHQAPLFMGYPRQEYWSGLPFPSPGHLPNLGTKPKSPASLALAGGSPTTVYPALNSLSHLCVLGISHGYITPTVLGENGHVHSPWLNSQP